MLFPMNLPTLVDSSCTMRSKSRGQVLKGLSAGSETTGLCPDSVRSTSLAPPEVLHAVNIYLNSLNSSLIQCVCLPNGPHSPFSPLLLPYLSSSCPEFFSGSSASFKDSDVTPRLRREMTSGKTTFEWMIPGEFAPPQMNDSERERNYVPLGTRRAAITCLPSERKTGPSPSHAAGLVHFHNNLRPESTPLDKWPSQGTGKTPPAEAAACHPAERPLRSFRHSGLEASSSPSSSCSSPTSSTWWWSAGDLNTPENSVGDGGGDSHTRLATPTPTLPGQRLISCRRGGRRTMEEVALERRSNAVGEASGCGVEGGEGGGEVGGGRCWGGAKVSEWWRRQEGEGRRRKRKPGWWSFSLWITMALSLAVASPSSAALDNEIHGIMSTKYEPEFGDPIDNVTVAAGREARLSCVVDNLGNFRVGWLKVDSQTILSLQKRVVTHNTRISVTHDEHRTWNLHIRQVKETDRGCYMCQINTPVMKNRVGCIEVHVPPDIIYSLTSSDTTVNEGDNVNLRCVSEGYPTPEIKWKREDQRPIVVRASNSPKAVDWVAGGNLTLENVSRNQMGAYLCIASNKVPPSVSKRIIVNVNFSPVVKVDNQLIGAPLGTAVTVECKVEAFPKAVNYWERENGEMMLNNKKYELLEMLDAYRVTMQLTIRNFTREDEGKYRCISTNSLGKAETSIRIYVIEVFTAKPTTATAYNSFQTTTHSKLSNAIDTRNREGKSKIRDGTLGLDGATVSLGMDLTDNKQNRQRQMQRLDQTGEGRTGNGVGILGGPFQQGEDESQAGGGGGSSSATAKSSISTLWMNIFLLKVLTTWRLVQLTHGDVFL